MLFFQNTIVITWISFFWGKTRFIETIWLKNCESCELESIFRMGWPLMFYQLRTDFCQFIHRYLTLRLDGCGEPSLESEATRTA